MAPLLTLSLLILSLISPAFSSSCTSPTLQNSKLYTNCNNLPTLKSTLHWTYNPSNKTLSIAFTSPTTSNGWVAWGINPIGTNMAGTQALLAYKDTSGAIQLKTYNISSYESIVEGKLGVQVYEKRAEFNAKDGSITIFASVGSDGGKINHIWQVGPGVKNGFPEKHEFKQENLNSKGTLDLTAGISDGESESSKSDAGIRKRNIHGILNAVSWGLLFPIGVIIARYMRAFESADPAWFYLHVGCQISAYAIGVAGWATGLQLGAKSVGIVYTGHRCIGIVLFSIATLQIFALFLRPKKEHKYRMYWNIYHHSVGYAIVILGVINVFKGFDILEPEKKWKSAYISTLIALGALAVLLETFTWIVVCRKKKSTSSAKPYA